MSPRLPLSMLLAVLLAATGVACSKDAAPAQQVSLRVTGMTCGSCVKAITAELKKIEGVASVEVLLKKQRANVSYRADKVKVEALIEAINKLGYKASPMPPAS